jgi:hypothetical protein
LTWQNQGGATATSVNGAISLVSPASSSDSLRVLTKAYPATPFTFTVGFINTSVSANFSRTGIIISDGTKAVTFATFFNTSAYTNWGGEYATWTNVTTYAGAGGFSFNVPFGNSGQLTFLSVSDDGTNLTGWMSNNPYDLQRIQMFQVSRTAFLTPSLIGIFEDAANATFGLSALFVHWTGI